MDSMTDCPHCEEKHVRIVTHIKERHTEIYNKKETCIFCGDVKCGTLVHNKLCCRCWVKLFDPELPWDYVCPSCQKSKFIKNVVIE